MSSLSFIALMFISILVVSYYVVKKYFSDGDDGDITSDIASALVSACLVTILGGIPAMKLLSSIWPVNEVEHFRAPYDTVLHLEYEAKFKLDNGERKIGSAYIMYDRSGYLDDCEIRIIDITLDGEIYDVNQEECCNCLPSLSGLINIPLIGHSDISVTLNNKKIKEY